MILVNEVPIEKIKPYSKNAKRHPDNQIDLLVKQIAEGWDQPIVVDKDYIIIKGHARRLAALKMGIKSVPVVIRDDLTPHQVMAARIADNKLNESEWEWDLLRDDLECLSMLDFDLGDLGFNDDELKDFFDSVDELDNEVVKHPDYGVLENYADDQVNEMSEGVMRAIQIEFSPIDYKLAYETINHLRSEGQYVGGLILDFLLSKGKC